MKHRETKILTGSIKDVNAKTMASAVVALGSAVRTNRETLRVVDNVKVSKQFTICPMTAKTTGLIPMAFVADVQRSIDFYALLGLELRDTFKNPQGKLVWAHVQCEAAELMFSQASDPVVPSQQAVLFYLYCPDLVALREHLLSQGVKAAPISYPGHMPKGETRVEDPDGYVLLIGQAG